MITFTQLGKMGRLGNCMWQISAVLSHALRNDDDFIFPHWQYEENFPVLKEHYSNYIKPHRTYSEPYFHYAPIPVSGKREVLDLVGYYQDIQYVDDRVRHYLRLKNLEWQDDKCSIHCRRGDYVKQPQNHPTQGMDYFEKAMDKVKEKKFLVFSDDIAWCKKHFIGNSFEIVEGQDEITDMSLMSRCSSNIISNSSFSWWAAYLNETPNKIVVAPKTWFGPNLPHKTDGLYLPGWVKI